MFIRLGLALGGLWALAWLLIGAILGTADWAASWMGVFLIGATVGAVGFMVFWGLGFLLHWVFSGSQQ